MRSTAVLPSEYPAYMGNYIATVGDVDLFEELEISLHRFIRFVREIPMDKFDYRYAPGKWTIKEIIQHLIDCERVFAYRALAIARDNTSDLPGFDENRYAENSSGNNRHLNALLTEMSEVRQSTLTLFKSFSKESLENIGLANGNPVSVRAIGLAIIGHGNHHQKIFEERYLV